MFIRVRRNAARDTWREGDFTTAIRTDRSLPFPERRTISRAIRPIRSSGYRNLRYVVGVSGLLAASAEIGSSPGVSHSPGSGDSKRSVARSSVRNRATIITCFLRFDRITIEPGKRTFNRRLHLRSQPLTV